MRWPVNDSPAEPGSASPAPGRSLRTEAARSSSPSPRAVGFLSTQLRSSAPALVNAAVSELFAAAVDATEEAALNSIFMATTVVGRLGHTMLALPIDETVTILRAHGLDVHTP